MSIYIYNSLTRKKEEFIPLSPGQVKIYVCGPTVYDEPHIGHARSAYIFNVIRQYLIYKGYMVKFVRNVTDVDDKIIDKAKSEYGNEDLNSACKKIADRYLLSYHKALDDLGIPFTKPDVIEPKASEYIGKMIEFIGGLIKRGFAYETGGDVYFDIKKAANYGKLSHQSLDKMEIGARVTPEENKKNPLDFVLWKSSKPDEPWWESPWGRGRPGWHIECSVMSSDILGDEFDIHGGGIDLIFPHHENEIAQSEAAGKRFARYWIHHGLLTINGQKMAKSLGNFVTVKDVLSRYPACALKIFYLQAHYSSPIDFSWDRLNEIYKATQGFDIFFRKTEQLRKYYMTAVGKTADFIERYKKRFFEAMDDDFNTPSAIASLFELLNYTNRFIDTEKGSTDYAKIVNEAEDTIRRLGKEVLGIDFPQLFTKLSKEEEELINKRRQARNRKDFKTSDQLREELRKRGIIVEDTKEGQVWRRVLPRE
ncbi:MAG: cysteine--tRNA ligase [Candidatus Omnitrophica bacterium]|nr:cysteine--tRNA ligase [Candidatus Omnitrophota bacterium]